MKNLINKELRLSINKFFLLLPFLLGLLFFIPGWIYILVFMYFFWISVPQIFGAYQSQRDYDFMSMLPVSKKEIVRSKILSIYFIELLHIVFAIIFVIIHNKIYGSWNLFMDTNVAFFGVGILMFGVFNIIFLPAYFKTAYFFGKPLLAASAATFIYAFVFEFAAVMALSYPERFGWISKLLEGTLQTQLIVLFAGIVLCAILSILAIKVSQKNYESIV